MRPLQGSPAPARTRPFSSLWLALPALALIAAAAAALWWRWRTAAPLQPYLPLVPGNQWVYISGRGPLTIRVTDARMVGSGREVAVEETDQVSVTRRTYREERDRLLLYRSETGGHVQDYSREPQPVLLFPLNEGLSWMWTGPSGTRRYRYMATVTGTQAVATPAGQFPRALAIETVVLDVAEADKPLKHVQWLVPGVGIVRMEYHLKGGSVLTYELASYRLH